MSFECLLNLSVLRMLNIHNDLNVVTFTSQVPTKYNGTVSYASYIDRFKIYIRNIYIYIYTETICYHITSSIE